MMQRTDDQIAERDKYTVESHMKLAAHKKMSGGGWLGGDEKLQMVTEAENIAE